MSARWRTRSVVRPLGRLLAAITIAFTASAALAGQTTGGSAPPAKKAATRPAAKQPAARPIHANDPILGQIKAKVKPTAEELATIEKLYSSLRTERRAIARRVRREIADTHPGAAGVRKDRDARMAMLKETQEAVRKAVAPANERFIGQVTAALDESRRPAWKALAATLDLSPGALRPPSRPELAWRDPARGPKVGDPAPEFTLKDLDGNPVALASLRDKPVVLEFASLTAPPFRRTLPDATKLQQAGGYKGTVRWVLVYTLESHPSDGWALKQNTRAGIEIPKHKTYEERVAAARRLAEQLGPDWTVLIDDMKDSVATAYSGHPNRCYVIDPSGTILSRQIWFSSKDTIAALYAYFDGLKRQ